MITSRDNQHLKAMRRSKRRRGEMALLEGPHLIGEALALGMSLDRVLASQDYVQTAEAQEVLAALPHPPTLVEAKLLDELADADSPKGLLALARLPRPGLTDLPLLPRGLYVYTDGLQDPGNLGALARVAEATAVDGLCLGPGSAHANHPRALRASAGSLLRLRVAQGVAWEDLTEHLRPIAPQRVALATDGGRNLFEQDLGGPGEEGALLLALGAEGPGLSPAIAAECDLSLTIPLAGKVESLNATVAAALVLFERQRQRC